MAFLQAAKTGGQFAFGAEPRRPALLKAVFVNFWFRRGGPAEFRQHLPGKACRLNLVLPTGQKYKPLF
ncbi:MAG TPA: hypothetical protein VGO34_10925 [Alphaproteobacteria bacterium]|jgi:hypothetical protein